MKINFFRSIALLVLIATACSDDDPAAPDRMPLLTRATWRMVELTANGKEESFGPCFEENTFTFVNNGEYMEDHDCAKAVGDGQDRAEWEFLENQTKFKWNYETDIPESIVFNIVKLDDDAFEIEANGGKHAIRFETVSTIN